MDIGKVYIYILLNYTICVGFPSASDGKESACNAADLGSTTGLGRSPAGGHSNPLQSSYLENPHGQRSLVGHNPWGCKELDTAERLSTTQHRGERHGFLHNSA